MPRTVWACQPVSVIIWANVAPGAERSRAISWDCLLAGCVVGAAEARTERGNDLPATGFFAEDFLPTAAGLAADFTAGLADEVDLGVLVVGGVRFIECSRAKSGTGRSNALHQQRFKSYRQCPC